MRRSIVTILAAGVSMAALAAGVSMAAWSGGASAQGVGVDLYVGPGYGTYNDYSDYQDYRSGPRVYGYYYDDTPRHLRQPEDYRTGSKRWWKQMDRAGRGGHQE